MLLIFFILKLILGDSQLADEQMSALAISGSTAIKEEIHRDTETNERNTRMKMRNRG